MTSSGVIPRPEDREPPRFTQTGEMDTDAAHVVFGAEGTRVIILADGGDIVLTPHDQDLFARQLFRAMECAEVISAAEVPF